MKPDKIKDLVYVEWTAWDREISAVIQSLLGRTIGHGDYCYIKYGKSKIKFCFWATEQEREAMSDLLDNVLSTDFDWDGDYKDLLNSITS